MPDMAGTPRSIALLDLRSEPEGPTGPRLQASDVALMIAGTREPPSFAPSSPRQRDRLWELSTNLHCSIIGTCLSTADLRALLTKLGDARARGASEHDLHGQAVSRAGRKDEGGKLLHKLLDRRHERDVARFARAGTAEDVRR